MKKFVFLLLISLSVEAQTGAQVEARLNEILTVSNSKEIAQSAGLKQMKKRYGKKSLVYLAKFFDHTYATKVYSDCHNRFLTLGEVAIIVADHIDRMPYFTLTGIQNCTLDHCKDNPNFIEYYFPYIKSYQDFQANYYRHLRSIK